jgi:hypothetical protein
VKEALRYEIALTSSFLKELKKLPKGLRSRIFKAVDEIAANPFLGVKLRGMHYSINWLGGFEINPRDQAAAELDKTRSLQLKTNWVTINEIRQLEGLERLPGADVVLGLSKLQNGTPQNISSATSKRKLELERKFRKPVDQLLAERIAAGKSVNKICEELGIGKQTFHSYAEEHQLKR